MPWDCSFSVAGIAFAAAPEPPAAPKTLDELKQRIEKVVKDQGVPAIGIALVNREGPVWVAGWGKADFKSGRAADQDTLFRIGSVSKMFAGLAVLKLEEEGKLSLDDKVRDRAPDLAFENPWEATHPVRIAHLLEHTTGWDNMHVAEYAYDAPDTMTIKQGLDYHPDSRKSRWPPGSRQAYNNIGPAVAAYIVEKVTGQRYEDYIANEFFTPLGMTSTSYFRTKLYDDRGATLYIGATPAGILEDHSSAVGVHQFLRARHGAVRSIHVEARLDDAADPSCPRRRSIAWKHRQRCPATPRACSRAMASPTTRPVTRHGAWRFAGTTAA